MRFSCDRCDAQYMISDEKVGPNGVKVRCKKCGHVILVRRPAAAEVAAPEAKAPIPGAAPGGSGEHALDAELGQAFDAAFGSAGGAPEAPAAPAPDPDATQAVSPEEAARLAARSAAPEPAATEWYVAIGQAQVGPLPLAEVRRKWEAGDVGPDSLVWRPGMGDWAPLTGVSDLAAYLAPVPHGAARLRPAEVPAQPAPRASTTVATPAQAPKGDVTWKPVGASALAALASEEIASQAPAPKQEAKAAPAVGSLVDGLPDGGGVDPTGAIPLQIKALEHTGEAPAEKRSTVARGAAELRRRRSSVRTVAALVAVLLLAGLVGGGYLAYDRYLRPGIAPRAPAAEAQPAPPAPQASASPPAPAPQPAAPQPASQPAAEAPVQPGAPQATETAPAAAVAAAPPPAPPPGAKEAEAAKKKAPAKVAPARPARAEKAKEAPARAVAKAEPAPAPAAAPAKKKGSDLLDFDSNDSALDEALGSKPSGRSVYVPPAPGGEGLPERVTDSQVNETIMTRVSALQQCLADSKSSGAGVLKMRWSIAPDGSVQNLKAISPENASTKFAGCVTDVLKGLRFPKTVQGRSEVTFPFKY